MPCQKITFDQLIAASGLSRLEARLLLTKASGLSREALIAHGDEGCPAATAAHFGQYCERRRQGEPIAYLLGTREFLGRTFRVGQQVLIPRPDTESLVARALELLAPLQAPRVLDLGTGSGVIAITLALECPDATVIGTDQSPGALAIARENAAALGAVAGFLAGDWWSAVDDEPPFDLIVSNPPYIAADDPHLGIGDLRHEPRAALTPGGDGTSALSTIVGRAATHLLADGWLLLEHGHEQGPVVRRMLGDAGFVRVATRPDLAGRERTTEGRKPF